MKSDIKLVRAVGTEFLSRKLKSILLFLAIPLAALIIFLLWLTTIDVWWWLLATPGLLLAIVAIVAAFLATRVIRIFQPYLTKEQSGATAEFVDKLERVAENVQTPMFIIVFRVLHDIVRPKGKTFLQTLVDDGKTLHPDYLKLRQQFK